MENKQLSGPSPSVANEISLSLDLGIVGGGKACKYFLELLANNPFPYININIVGICDINPEAEGLLLAKEMGIYTTNNFNELYKIEDLDHIIELTGSREVLLEVIRNKPKGIGILEHNFGYLLRNLFEADLRLISMEQQLMVEKTVSDFLIQQSTAAIVILNPDFTIAEANEAYLKAVKRPKEDVIGSHCYKVSHNLNAPCSSSHPEIQCPMVETMRKGMSAHAIHEHPGPGGQLTYCDIVTLPLKDQDDQIYRVIEIWRDITKEFSHHWEKRVQHLKSNLQNIVQEDRMISLGKLAASCAHEINNPIQGLLTFSHFMEEILAEGKPSEKDLAQFQKHLSLMSRELERCGNIVSGLLSFSRESKLEYTKIDLNETLQTVLTLTRHKMHLRSIELITDLSATGLMVKGDAKQLQQCFLNLIFNSIEAMIPGGGELRVSSSCDTTNKLAQVQIQDTGSGIPKEKLDHIFDPFFTTK
ncbi:MAG: PAS domain-containing protein, partial [Desulfobacterales bacterium]